MDTERGGGVGAKSSTSSTGGEKVKHHGTLRDTIAASSRVLSLSPKGDIQWVYSVGLIFHSVRTNK